MCFCIRLPKSIQTTGTRSVGRNIYIFMKKHNYCQNKWIIQDIHALKEKYCVLIINKHSASLNCQLQSWYETHLPRSLVCDRRERCKVSQAQNWTLAPDSGQKVIFCLLSQEINDRRNLLTGW